VPSDTPQNNSSTNPDPAKPQAKRRRSLRAVFAADIAGFSGQMSLNETATVDLLGEIRVIGRRELEKYDGWLFGLPGDGLFATFESAINAVQCALDVQIAMAANPRLADMPLRIGVHLGEVLLDDGIPYGETLNIASRLESLAEPGGILVSGTVMDAVSARLSATFEARGTPQLKNIPRRVPTFAVKPPPKRTSADEPINEISALDRTARFDRAALSGEIEAQPTPANINDTTAVTKQPTLPETPAPTDHLPLDQIARAARDAAAEREQTLTEMLNTPEASRPAQPPSPEGPATVSPQPDTENASQNAGEPLSGEFIDQLTRALAEYIGPFAKTIVAKQLQDSQNAFDLIAKLEQHIPTEQERVAFRVRASHLNRTLGRS